jgi:hypothetical protein
MKYYSAGRAGITTFGSQFPPKQPITSEQYSAKQT